MNNIFNNVMAAMSQVKANPAAVLQKRGFNVPANMTDPQAIINHLLQSGQLGQSRLAQLLQMIK